MALVNEGDVVVNNWTVELDLPAGLVLDVTSVWGAKVAGDAEGDLLFTALDYNAAGATAGFGFNASYTGDEAVSFAGSELSFVPLIFLRIDGHP
ncbi:cellulose binding domain-containing protein [Roseomonas sp. DSM 102946]|nr:cellulose binding domain-containing protein [Roseomonas sp. DSM 102946]